MFLLVLGMGWMSTARAGVDPCNSNVPPVAYPQHVVFSKADSGGQITLNGSDHENDNLTYEIVSGPSHGKWKTDPPNPPNLTYEWDGSSNVDDSFTFRVNDGCHNSRTVTVKIEIVNDLTQSNAPAVPNPVVTNTGEETSKDITLSGSDHDGDSPSYSLLKDNGPSHGTVTGTPPNVTYTPEDGHTGGDCFYYNASDGNSDIPRRSDPACAYVYTGTPNVSSMPPVADAGPDRNMGENGTCPLDASGSFDVAGRDLNYSWYCCDESSNCFQPENHDKAQATFPSGKSPGTYTCSVSVSNSDGKYGSDCTEVEVAAPAYSGPGLALLALFCAIAGVRTIRRRESESD